MHHLHDLFGSLDMAFSLSDLHLIVTLTARDLASKIPSRVVLYQLQNKEYSVDSNSINNASGIVLKELKSVNCNSLTLTAKPLEMGICIASKQSEMDSTVQIILNVIFDS
jgi:hypothetical protein